MLECLWAFGEEDVPLEGGKDSAGEGLGGGGNRLGQVARGSVLSWQQNGQDLRSYVGNSG